MPLRALSRFVTMQARGVLDTNSRPDSTRIEMSTVTINPGDNLAAKIAAANAGDIVQFSGGNYSVAKLALKAGVKYDGQGKATLIGPSGDTSLFIASGCEFAGFIHTTGWLRAVDNASGVYLHDCIFRDGSNPVTAAGIRDSRIIYNTFLRCGGTGVMLYAQAGVSVDNNLFDTVVEAVHIMGQGADKLSVSRNVGHRIQRHFIEVQQRVTNAKFNSNYVDQWRNAVGVDGSRNDFHMALSLPTSEGGNNEVGWNTLINDGPTASADLWAKAAIEIDGHGWGVHENYLKNWGADGTRATASPVTRVSNTVIGSSWPASASDKVFALNAANAPAQPPVPTDAGARTGAQPPIVIPPMPTPSAMTAEVSGLTITLGFPATPSAGILERRDTEGPAGGWVKVADVPQGATSAVFVAPRPVTGYRYDLRVTAGTFQAIAANVLVMRVVGDTVKIALAKTSVADAQTRLADAQTSLANAQANLTTAQQNLAEALAGK